MNAHANRQRGGVGAAVARTRRRRFTRREWLLVAVICACLGGAAGLAHWLELQRPAPDPSSQPSDDLYLTPAAARRMSLSFNGLAADWYWLRTLQYVGRKAAAHEGGIQIDDLSSLNLKILAPLLENATTLDPQFMAAYEYGAVVLPAVDVDAAVHLIRKGIAANPQAWRLRSHLGYIYWQQNRFREAGLRRRRARPRRAPVALFDVGADVDEGREP